MQQNQTTSSVPAVQLPVMLVAELQDSLLVVVHDLSRLDGLLAHAMENLMDRFTCASKSGRFWLGRVPRTRCRSQCFDGCCDRAAISGHGLAADCSYFQNTSGLCLPTGFRVHGH